MFFYPGNFLLLEPSIHFAPRFLDGFLFCTRLLVCLSIRGVEFLQHEHQQTVRTALGGSRVNLCFESINELLFSLFEGLPKLLIFRSRIVPPVVSLPD